MCVCMYGNNFNCLWYISHFFLLRTVFSFLVNYFHKCLFVCFFTIFILFNLCVKYNLNLETKKRSKFFFLKIKMHYVNV